MFLYVSGVVNTNPLLVHIAGNILWCIAPLGIDVAIDRKLIELITTKPSCSAWCLGNTLETVGSHVDSSTDSVAQSAFLGISWIQTFGRVVVDLFGNLQFWDLVKNRTFDHYIVGSEGQVPLVDVEVQSQGRSIPIECRVQVSDLQQRGIDLESEVQVRSR